MENNKSIMLLALAGVLASGGFAYWQWNNQGDAAKRLSNLQKTIPEESKVRADLATAQASLTDYSTKLNHLELSVPDVAYVPTLLKELETVGIQSKIVVTGVRPVPAPPTSSSAKDKEKKSYEELDIDITGRGNYRSVMTMVDALKTFPKIVAVTTMGLTPKKETGKTTDVLDTTVRLKAYMFKSNDDKADKGEKSDKKALSANERPGGNL